MELEQGFKVGAGLRQGVWLYLKAASLQVMVYHCASKSMRQQQQCSPVMWRLRVAKKSKLTYLVA